MEVLNLTSKEIETFLNHFDLVELNQIKNILNLGYYNLGNIYNDLFKICEKVEEDKLIRRNNTNIKKSSNIKFKIEKLSDKELIFLNTIVSLSNLSNMEEIDEYLNSDKEYVPTYIEDTLFNEIEKRKIKDIDYTVWGIDIKWDLE